VIVSVDGSAVVLATPNYTWVSENGRPGSRVPAFNKTVPPVVGTPVLIARSPKQNRPFEWEIIGVNAQSVQEGEATLVSQYETGAHATTHQYPSEADRGTDYLTVFQPALAQLKTIPTTGMFVKVLPYTYSLGGVAAVFEGQTVDMTPYVPAAGMVHLVLLSLDPLTNTISVSSGAEVLDNGIIPIPHPPTPSQDSRLSSYIVVRDTTVTIDRILDVEDARDFLSRGDGVVNYSATAVGQVLYSADGATFGAETPVTGPSGWLVNNNGILIIQ